LLMVKWLMGYVEWGFVLDEILESVE
jgi:hypothetical protein